MNLLTIADGQGDSNSCPVWYPEFYKWPEIIKLMTKNVNLTNLSRYGAGGEYIINCLKHNINNKDVVLIQWPVPNRLDLLLDTDNEDFWQQSLDSDSSYKDNVVTINNNLFWLTSTSKDNNVQHYISLKQHQLRLQLTIDYAKLLIEKNNIKYKFLLSPDSEYLKTSVSETSNWVWHEKFKGMFSFRKVSKYSDLDFGLVQPISLIQFDFIKQFIMPAVDLPWRNSREIDAVENMLHKKYKQALEAKPNDSH